MSDAQRRTLLHALAMWALAFVAIVVARVTTSQAKAVATLVFLYLPITWLDRQGIPLSAYGFTSANWKKEALIGLKWSLAILPPFALLFAGFVLALPHLPDSWVRVMTPYGHEALSPALRLPHPPLPEPLPALLAALGVAPAGMVERATGLILLVVDQLFVVALSEEFFYRGFLQARLQLALPGGPTFAGATVGRAFWLTQALFAVGHLAELLPWRLSVFFPALLFGLLRERTGTVVAGTVLHALCNLATFTLEASTFGR